MGPGKNYSPMTQHYYFLLKIPPVFFLDLLQFGRIDAPIFRFPFIHYSLSEIQNKKNLMKFLSNILFAASFLFVTGCSDGGSEVNGNTGQEPISPEFEISPVQNENPATVVGESQAAGVRLNPPHGEPGHRCEIAVGAPLDSEPTNTQQVINPSAPQLNDAPQPVMIQEPAQTATGKGKINPPHGEPGHDCAVAVGAPLN